MENQVHGVATGAKRALFNRNGTETVTNTRAKGHCEGNGCTMTVCPPLSACVLYNVTTSYITRQHVKLSHLGAATLPLVPIKELMMSHNVVRCERWTARLCPFRF
jgi:hypothetical protein